MPELNCPKCKEPYEAGEEICRYCGFILPLTSGVLTAGTILHNRYEIQSLAHIGGMGYVYIASDKNLYDRICVIKQVKEPVKTETDQKKLEQEALRMSQLSHPNAAMILDQFIEGRYYYLVMQYISGTTLSEVYEERGGKLSEGEVVNWAITMCDVVGYLHGKGVMHRDISPENIMLSEAGSIMFIDFGTMRELRQVTDGKAGGVGKFGFTPSEQWRGKPVEQSDIFAIGATVYYLLTGYLPLSERLRAGGKPEGSDFRPEYPLVREKNDEISAKLEVVLQKALQLDIRSRYASATEMGNALRGLLGMKAGVPQSVAVLQLDSRELDFGKVRPGRKVSKNIIIKNTGAGKLTGTISATEDWIEVKPVKIELAGGAVAWFRVTVSNIQPEFQGTGEINIDTNEGRAKTRVNLSTGRRPTGPKIPMLAWVVLLFIVISSIISIVMTSVKTPPELFVEPGQIYFSDLEPGIVKSDSRFFEISNIGGGNLTGTVIKNDDWLHISPAEFKVKDDTTMIEVWVDTIGKDYGDEADGLITILTGNDKSHQIKVNMKLSNIIFEDDFSDTDSGWAVSSDEVVEWMYQDNKYRVYLKRADTIAWSSNGKAIEEIDDFVLEVDAQMLSIGEGSGPGIIFRYQDNNNYYVFRVDASNGYYVIEKLLDGEWTVIKEWTYSPLIKKGKEKNRLKILCIRSDFWAYINGYKLTTVVDDSFERGYIALAVSKGNDKYNLLLPNAEALFDNFKITKPE